MGRSGLVVALMLAGMASAAAALRFDMFVGYDGIVPQGSWFPVAFEVYNDGPGFTATIEVNPGNFSGGQKRTVEVELPTGTTKRFILPVHNAASYNAYWDATLRDGRGRVRAEIKNQRVRRLQESDMPLAGALTRTPPPLPELKKRPGDQQPVMARLQPVTFPDNPIVLEGLDTIYLASERALELKAPQVGALLAWLHAGGHLVVSVEHINHLSGPGEWLKRLLPAEITGMTTLPPGPALQDWVSSRRRFDGSDHVFTSKVRARRGADLGPPANPFAGLTSDDTLGASSMQAATLKLRDGRVLIGSDSAPLAVIGRRGRGQITLLSFAPELEPFKSWANAPYFWAKMTDLPPEILGDNPGATGNRYAGRSLDGVFGAMVDSDQIRKLPVGWLLLLLLAYLAVIGPLDQYWLKKLNKQMLTWVTFPLYVALFSALIYFIGYKLRAGESEWNELQVIDVIPHGAQADLRGRTYASIYSPVNARYHVASDQPVATLRGESMGSFGGSGQEASRANVRQVNNSFEAELAVPVWTSQLFVSDWWNQGPAPLGVELANGRITVANHLEVPLVNARVVRNGELYELGTLPPGRSQEFQLGSLPKRALESFIRQHGEAFANVAGSRQRAFGDNTWTRLPDVTNCTMAASFVTEMNTPNNNNNNWNNFQPPPGFDLGSLVERGDTVLLAFAPGHTPVKPLNKFAARRNHRNTLYRVVVPGE